MDFEDTFTGRPNTRKTYLSLFRKHIQEQLAEGPVWLSWNENCTFNMMARWEQKGLSRNTRITLTRLLGRYVKFMGGPDIEPQKLIKSLARSEQQTEVVALSQNQAQKLMNTAQKLEPKFYPVMMLALHAGLRRGEIFGLRCGDVDMLSGKIKVSHSYDGPTKNGKSRVVPMHPTLAKALTEARNLLMRDANEKVFERFDPNPLLRRCCRRAGIREIRFHDLRHSFASMALTAGTTPKQVAEWLGHSSVVTTMAIYWHLTDTKADLSFLPE
jgi:integrase